MSALLRSLCCCLPSSRSHIDDPNDEHQPLLNPDILPQAPPRPANQRTTEQQREEQETLRRILNVASERLIPISAPSFLSSQPPRTEHDRPHSRSSSISTTASSSPTLTATGTPSATPGPSSPTGHSRSQTRPHSTFRAPTDAPVAPIRARVVHLGPGGEVLNSLPPVSPSPSGDGEGEGSLRRREGTGKRGSGRKSRPPSNHSLKTLPRGGGGGAYGAVGGGQPSPLRRGRASGEEEEGEEEEGAEEEYGEDEGDEEGEDEDGSRFDTLASYRTASSGRSFSPSRSRVEGSTVHGRGLPGGYPRTGLRDLWAGQGSSVGEEEDNGELQAALRRLERETDERWTLEDVGAVVGELGGGAGEGST